MYGDQPAQPQRKRRAQIVWNPTISTQFIVAFEDPNATSLNLWDLRTPDYPVATFTDIVSSGVSGISWSSLDHNLIQASSLDGTTVCFDYKNSQKILDYPKQERNISKLSWSPHD